MSFDLTGLRPDEYYNQRADRWQISVALRNAIGEGMRAARSEKAGWDGFKDAEIGRVG